MDILTQKLAQEFETCREHTFHIKDEIILDYYEDVSQFEKDRDLFFSVKPQKIEEFYLLDYPFKGHEVFDEKKFMDLVDDIPEFIVSLIKKKMESILTLPRYQDVKRPEPIMLSLKNMRESSQIIYHSWNLFLEISTNIRDGYDEKLRKLLSLLKLFQTGKPHYDILGLLQNIYNSIIIMGNSHGFEGFEQFKPIIHLDPFKRETLYSIAGRELTPLRILNDISPEDNIQDIPRLVLSRLSKDGYPQLNTPGQYFIQEPGVPYSPPEVQSVDAAEESELLNTRESSLALKLEKLKTPFISRNKSLLNSLVTLQPVIDSKMKILITGETGTGKDVLSNAIHEMSKRKGKFVAINCASITGTIFESEIFGHVKGAFTGAIADKKGAFELADGGTLFLDEIGDLPIDQQAKLLRVIESNKFTRVGGQQEIKVDVRVISATHIDLEKQIQDKLFREDLYSRINEISVDLIPLDERKEDVPLLAEVLFKKHAKLENVKVPSGLSPDSFLPLSENSWPRNVRQLDNHVHRIVAFYKQSNQSLGSLKSLIDGEEVNFNQDTDLIFTGDNDEHSFEVYLQSGCSINKTWKKLSSSKDTVTKIIYGIFVRLLVNKGSEAAAIEYLIDTHNLHRDHTQAFENEFREAIKRLKDAISENKSIKRQLNKADDKLLREFLSKI
jgi:DNA-binding NtrC family response regulator